MPNHMLRYTTHQDVRQTASPVCPEDNQIDRVLLGIMEYLIAGVPLGGCRDELHPNQPSGFEQRVNFGFRG